MHITILALGSRGDVQPYANLGEGLIAGGHQVRLVTFENFDSLAAECGLDFHPIRGNAQNLVVNAGASTLALVRSFSSLAAGYGRDLSAPQLLETDLIINQLPAGLYGYDLAQKAGIPMLLAAVIPLHRTGAFPLMGFPDLRLAAYNRATYALGEQIVWQMFRPVINRWRKTSLQLPPLPLHDYFDRLGTPQMPILNGFSPSVVQRPSDWGEHIHITGYWFPGERTWQPPADLQAFLEAGSPPVFIGFGSMPVRDPRKTTHIVLEALRQSGRRGILHTGWGGIGNLDLPDTVFAIHSAPYGWLFPRMAMVIHHGGSGTTAHALRAGVPSMAVPFVFDQFYWGDCIARTGAGPRPIPLRGAYRRTPEGRHPARRQRC